MEATKTTARKTARLEYRFTQVNVDLPAQSHPRRYWLTSTKSPTKSGSTTDTPELQKHVTDLRVSICLGGECRRAYYRRLLWPEKVFEIEAE